MTTTNKVIKDCIFCGKKFEDKTRPKNKKTCSRKCADEVRKERQRIEYRKENPAKPNQRERFYYDHYEYPFWIGDGKEGGHERIANNQFYKHETVKSNESLEYIQGAIERYERMGGRKRHAEYAADYESGEESKSFIVRFSEHEHKKPSEVKTYKMTPEELREYRKSRAK